MNQEFYKIAAAVPKISVANCDYNADSIIELCDKLSKSEVQMAIFPQLTTTGVTCGDLFHSEMLVYAAQCALLRVVEASRAWDMSLIVGSIIAYEGRVYDCGVAISRGEIIAVVPGNINGNDSCFANGNEVDAIIKIGDRRVRMLSNQMLPVEDVKVAIVIGDDEISLSLKYQAKGQVVAHLGARKASMGSRQGFIEDIKARSLELFTTYIYVGSGYGESTTDHVYDGCAIVAQNGELIAQNEQWQSESQSVVAEVGCATPHFMNVANRNSAKSKESVVANPFLPDASLAEAYCNDAVNIQVLALMRRMEVTWCKNLVIGISGGLDSTLALLIAVKVFDRMGLDRKGIIGVTMPGFGTTDRTYNNALVMMRSLGITMREISIVPAVKQHFADINHDINVHDITYENSQARERTQLLMDIANQVNGMVLGTGDMSELALGWATYNGDHMSMYGINAGVPKTLVRRLVEWIASTEQDEACRKALLDVIDTPISPELVPADSDGNIKQKTEDLVGPYELHDFFLYYTLKYGYRPQRIYTLAMEVFAGAYDGATIKHWLTTFCRRFFNQQFKRSCMPDGPCVCGLSLSPRGGWSMPSDASSAMWLKECESL
ncbi:MAG: NAD(+) synthase [Muribaculaceae bacterium]|nr:NAD(+) synthase [Muribaculaceae bacterium]